MTGMGEVHSGVIKVVEYICLQEECNATLETVILLTLQMEWTQLWDGWLSE